MPLIFPKGTERLEKYVNETSQNLIFKHITRNVMNTRLDTPLFATILLRNDLTAAYERMLGYMDKFYGKHGRTVILSLVIKNDMGLDHVKTLWSERSVRLTSNLFTPIPECDEKYIRFFIEDPKFLRLAREEFRKPFNAQYIEQYLTRLLNIGFEYPKFLKLMGVLYKETENPIFLPPEAKDIFVF